MPLQIKFYVVLFTFSYCGSCIGLLSHSYLIIL